MQVEPKIKHKDKILKLALPHFNYHVSVYFADDPLALIRRRWPNLGKKLTDEINARAYTLYEPESQLSIMVFSHDPSIMTIVHECFHVIWRLHSHIGANLENEIVAYHMGWIVSKVTDFLYKNADAYAELRAMQKKKLTKEPAVSIVEEL